MSKIRIRFDGPPGPEAGRFVEVENEYGESISFGEWKEDGDDWILEFDRYNCPIHGKQDSMDCARC
jgi:hypothetical protein